MALRESKRHRDKRPFIPFGDMMLPVIGFVAVGLLVAGIKLFFLSGPKPQTYESVAIAEQKIQVTIAPPPTVKSRTLPAEKRQSDPSTVTPTPPLSAPQRDDSDLPLSTLAVPYPRPGKQESEKGRTAGSSSGKMGVTTRKKEIKNPIVQSRRAENPPKSPKERTSAKSKPVPKNEIKQTTKPQASAKWGVQIGSFTEKSIAVSIQEKVRKKGRNAIVTSAVIHEKKYYRVIVLCGNDRESAEKQARVLVKDGYPILVVPIK